MQHEVTFAEHVRLIMQQDGLTENRAKLRAWCEGETWGLERKEREARQIADQERAQ
jgi:hypothetical protein